MKTISTFLGIIISLGIITGVIVKTFATKESLGEVKQLAELNREQIQQMKDFDLMDSYDKRRVYLATKCDTGKCDDAEKEELRVLNLRLDELKIKWGLKDKK